MKFALNMCPRQNSGDYAIIHVGFALNLLSESEALETLAMLRQISAFDPAPGDKMNYFRDYRDADLVHKTSAEIARTLTKPWVIMEICGGQTHAIMRYGLDQIIPAQVELVHGPGCPVCVTSLELLDKALAIAATPGVIFTSLWRYAACSRLNR